MMREIPIETLRQLLRYEPETGKLYWLERPVEMFTGNWNKTAEQLCSWWNHRFAGQEALTATGVYGCRAGRIFRQTAYAHRVALALTNGEWPSSVDHINGDRSDNRIANLRVVDHQTNMQNKKVYRTSVSGQHGVVPYRHGKWQAYITVNKKRRHIGYFSNLQDAIAARKAAEAECGAFHANHGRAA